MSSTMSLNIASQFPIEKLSLNSIQIVLLVIGLVEFFLLRVLTDRKRISTFFFGFQSSVASQFDDSRITHERVLEPSTMAENTIDQIICSGDVDIVCRSLGLFHSCDEAASPGRFDAGDILDLFEEEPARLDEAREAFDVFDGNRDGYIDAGELQKVLVALGMREGSDVERCRRMIGVFDENGDGRIDFDEFVRVTETH